MKMFKDNTDKSWEKIGKMGPYYGVLTFDKFRNSNFDDNEKVEFFRSGKQRIIRLIDRIESLVSFPGIALLIMAVVLGVWHFL